MKLILSLCVALVVFASQSSLRAADEPVLDGSDVEAELNEREQKIQKLTVEEQLKLRAAQQKAAEDPLVLEALKKRNEAIVEFRMALRNSMIREDPKMAEILDKLAVGVSPGF
jgi:biopolymer transport protein ExbB/TolQ